MKLSMTLLVLLAAFLAGPSPCAAASQTVVSLTFDDGRASQSVARSILAEHGMHATFYVNSPRLGSSNFYLSWQQVQDLYSDGNEIGGHTAYHANLPELDATEAKRQICYDRINLLNHGFQPTGFAYPYGAHNAAVEALVQSCGYNSGRTTDSLSSPAETIPPQNPYAIHEGSSSDSLSTLESDVTDAVQSGGGWVPIVFHDICSGCSSVAITQADFTAFLDWLQQQAGNGVTVQTVQQVIGGSVQPAVSGPGLPPAPNGANRLRNVSLELDTNVDHGPDCWQFANYPSSFSWTRTTDAHSGTYAERVDVSNFAGGDNKLIVQQDLGSCTQTVIPGHRYRLTGWYKSSNPISFTVFSRNSGWAFPYWASSPAFPASSSWAQASWVTPVVPSDVNGLSFGLTLAANGSMTVDDFGIDDANPTGPPDTTLPTTSVTTPANGATVSGTVGISATASDDVAIDHVDFLVDGMVIGTRVTGPLTVDWSSRSVANGNHTLTTRAVDTAGNTKTSSPVTVFVSNQVTNLLQNPSLETASGSTPSCWIFGGYGTNSYTWARTGDAHTGGFSETLNITSLTTGDRKLVNAQDAGVCAPAAVPGHNYTVSAWYKSAAQPSLFVYYRNSAGNWVYLAQSPKLPTASSWRLGSWATPALPAGATNISVGMGLWVTGSLTMDDFSLVDNSPPPDTTPPSSAISCSLVGSSSAEGTCGTGFYNGPVQVELSATDNPGGSGVSSIRYTTDGSDPTSENGSVYGGVFSVASTTTVKYRAFDAAGNAESVNSHLIRIDSTAPTSGISCNNGACSNGFYNSSVSVTLSATDNTGGAGVESVRYTTDGTDPSLSNGSVYDGAFSVADTTTVKYRAYDNAGNAEAVNSALVQVDSTPPTSTISCSGTACKTGYYNAAVTVSLASSDGNSGVASIRYTTDGTDPSPSNGSVYGGAFSVASTTAVKYRAFDNAGNAEGVNSQLIQIDTTPPTVSVTSPASGAIVDGTTTLAASANDNVAIDHVDFLIDGQAVGSATSTPYSFSWNSQSVADGPHTITARAVDSAGTATTSSGVLVKVANTNLLQNPSLEAGSGSTPTCWLLGGYGTNTFTWTRTSDAHTGSLAEDLSVSSYTNGDRKLVNAQDAGACAPAVTPGRSYMVTSWYKSAVRPFLIAFYRNSSGSWVYWANSPKLDSASSWMRASWTTPPVPAGATRLSVGIGLYMAGSVTMDDLGLFAAG